MVIKRGLDDLGSKGMPRPMVWTWPVVTQQGRGVMWCSMEQGRRRDRGKNGAFGVVFGNFWLN